MNTANSKGKVSLPKILTAILVLATSLAFAAADPSCKNGNDITNCFADPNFKAAVYARIGKTPPSPILVADAESINQSWQLMAGQFDLTGKDIKNLDGIEYFTKLQSLYVSGNPQLTSIDISKNTELRSLVVNSPLTSIDVSNNTKLLSLGITNTSIKSLDVSKNTQLTTLNVPNNPLTLLDISKNTQLTLLMIGNTSIKSLNLSSNTKLEQLYADGAQLSLLNLSKNTELKNLDLNNNPLAELNVSKNTKLTFLLAGGIGLTEINLSKNINLVTLGLAENYLTEIDLSKNTKLTDLNLNSSNVLTELDLSKNTMLTELRIQYSPNVKKLDLSKNTALKFLAIGGTLGIGFEEFTGLEQLASLKELYIYDIKTTGLLDLSNLNLLEKINVEYTKINSLKLPASLSQLKALCLQGNKLGSEDNVIGLTTEIKNREDCKDAPENGYRFEKDDNTTPVPVENLAYLNTSIDPQNAIINVTVTSEQMKDLAQGGWGRQLAEIREIALDQKLKREFDIVFTILDTDLSNGLGFQAMNEAQDNGVSGIGTRYRSGVIPKQKGNIFFPQGDLAFGPSLHEVAHSWGNGIVLTGESSHWGVSNAGGLLGGFKYIRTATNNGECGQGTLYQASILSNETNPDGSFKEGRFSIGGYSDNAMPYSSIELYTMGMKSAQALRDENFVLDVYNGISNRDADGYFCATGKTSYTIDDIIAMNGPRIPSYEDSQKEFKVLTIIISEQGKATHTANIVQDLYWFAGPCSKDTTYAAKYNGLYNFCDATYGEGKLLIGGVQNSERKNIQYTITFNSDGGTSVSSQNIYDGDFVKKPANPAKEGFQFKGWFSETLGRLWSFFVDFVTSNTQLTAQWEEITEDEPDPSSSSSGGTTVEYCDWGDPTEHGDGGCWQISDASNREQCVLYGVNIYTNVPQSGIGAGKRCQGGTLVPKSPSPIRIPQVAKGPVFAYTSGNSIILGNLPAGAKVEVYGLNGKLVYSNRANPSIVGNGVQTISVQTKGMYIVKTGTQIFRVAVR
jgi:hypothetical protein